MPGIYTTGTYDTSEWEPIDLVTVSHNEAISALRQEGIKIMELFGGKIDFLEKKIRDVREGVVSEMQKKLPNNTDYMIVGLDIETTVVDRAVVIVASGTLLRKKKIGGGKRLTRRKRN
jgi:uncharacterized protein YbjQ (UPF0145 family)